MSKSLKNTFIKSIIILTSGSILAQLISVIASPCLTRLYSPQEIGVYTYILSIALVFSPIINLRYDMSIVMEEEEEKVFPLIKLAIIISFVASLIVTILYIIYLINSNKYNGYLYTGLFMFILLLTYGVINVVTAYNNRNKEYKIITSVFVFRAFSQNVGAVMLGISNIGLLGLLLPYIIGQTIGIKKQIKTLKEHIKKILSANKISMIEVLKLHYKQPMYSTPALFLNGFSYLSITFFIEALFGMSVVGFYSISVRILGLPLSVISGNVSRVFFEEASREFDKTNQFYNSFRKTTLFLIALTIPMVLLMIFVASPLIGRIFGENWSEAGVYIKVLSIMFGLRFIVSTLSPGLLIVKKQKYELILQSLYIITSITSFIITKKLSLSVVGFLELINISFSLCFIIYFIIIYKFSIIGVIRK